MQEQYGTFKIYTKHTLYCTLVWYC